MSRYIDADVYVEEMLKIIDKFTETDKTLAGFAKSIIQGSVPMFPTADVEPVARGEWIEHYDECECPVCGETWNYCDNDTERFDCCPKCGARLVEHGKERER